MQRWQAGPEEAAGLRLRMVRVSDDLGPGLTPEGPRSWRHRSSITDPGRGGCLNPATGLWITPTWPLVTPTSITVGQGRVRISAPESVTRSVCSNWAVRLRSAVTTVQPSSQMSYSMVPSVSIGSIVKVMPVSMTVS